MYCLVCARNLILFPPTPPLNYDMHLLNCCCVYELLTMERIYNDLSLPKTSFGLVEANCKADLLLFMKAYVTVIINNTSVWSLYTKEPGEKENGMFKLLNF